MNVKLPANKMLMVDRLVARDGLTLIEYFDRLITEDIRREQSRLRDYFRDEEERARLSKEAFDNAF